jgi:hypothetical protein
MTGSKNLQNTLDNDKLIYYDARTLNKANIS